MKVEVINQEQARREIMLLMNTADERSRAIPACLVGGTGCGKTESIVSVARTMEGITSGAYRYWKVILSYCEPSDIGGVPELRGGKAAFAVPGWLPIDTDESGILHLEELDRCDGSVQNAAQQLALGGDIHGHELGKNVFVACCMNGTSDMYTTPMSEAMRTRVCSLFVSAHAAGAMESWQDWAEENGVSPMMRGFAKFRPDLIAEREEFEEMAVCNPRTRQYADRILAAAEKVRIRTDDILLPLLSGVIGRGAAVEMIAFRDMFKTAPDIETCITKPDIAPEVKELSVAFAVCTAIVEAVKSAERNRLSGAIKYIGKKLPEEIACYGMRSLGKKNPKVITMPEYVDFARAHKEMIGL